MNIAIDIRPLMESRYTGVSFYTYNLLKTLLEIDKKNNYYLFYNSFKNIKKTLPEFSGSNIRYCPFSFPNKLLNLSFKIFKKPKIDLLINKKFKTSIDLFFMPNWQFIALSKNCRKILTVHDLSCHIYPEFYSLKRKLWHKIINPQKLCQDFNYLIAVSKNTKKNLINLYKIPAEKISVVYSGINQPTTDNQQLTTIKSKYNLPDKFILYLGTLEPRKNIIGIIKAFEKFNNCQLVLAGPHGWLCREIHKVAKKSPLKNKIQFINYVEEKDKPTLYSLAEIFIYPSFYEGFGFPPLEAMASGAPVVTSLNSSLGEAAGGACLLIDPYNIEDSINAMRQILDNRQLKNNLILRGKKHTQKFNWQCTAEEMLGIFNRIV